MLSIVSTNQEIKPVIVGVLYITLGAIGVILNLTTFVMIVTRRVYRLSAYTIMANVALADALVLVITGCACGATILLTSLSTTTGQNNEMIVLNISNQSESKAYLLHLNKFDGTTSLNVNNNNLLKFNSLKLKKSRVKDSFLNQKNENQFAQISLQPNINYTNYKTTKNNFSTQQTYLMSPLVKEEQQQNKRFENRQKRFWQMSNNFANRRQKQNQHNNAKNKNQSKEQKSRGFGSLIKRSVYFASTQIPNVTCNNQRKQVKRSLLRFSLKEQNDRFRFLKSLYCFIEITAWTASITSYAVLGLNRCVAICFYGTKAKTFNRVSVAFLASILTWIVGICTACTGTFPVPLVLAQIHLWSISFQISDQVRPIIFVSISFFIYTISVTLQWICSILVLLKIRQVKMKISKNKLNQNSANRFRKQARLTFQFFYPSLFCTISSVVYFAKPFTKHFFSDTILIILHIIWLSNHMCNPFIYAYFNERMRFSYYEILTCSRLRLIVEKWRNQNLFKNRSRTRRSAHQRVTQQVSVRSVGANSSKSNGNFVRNSLQLQSRDFEQLCEFMMRVNPLYDSSEGWRESSDEDDSITELKTNNMSDTLIIGSGAVVTTPKVI